MKLYKLISLQIEINFSRIFKRCTNAPTLSRSECNIFSFHFPCLSGFLLICLINQRPSGPQKGCHTISTTFCGFPAKECGWWRLKPAKTTSVFFSLILALLRREGGGGKRKALIVSKKVLKRAKKVLDFDNGTVFENHIKSRIQHGERSELYLYFEWTEVR